MKILAIGGCGSMARYTLKAAQNFDENIRITRSWQSN